MSLCVNAFVYPIVPAYSKNVCMYIVVVGLLLCLNNNVEPHEQIFPALYIHLCWAALHVPAAQSNFPLCFCIVVAAWQSSSWSQQHKLILK